MSQPGLPQPYPPARQPPPPPGPPYPYPPQWHRPAPKRKGGGAVVLAIVLTVVLLGGGVAGYLLLADDSADPPKVDTSKDLAEAPMGCGLFTEVEISRYIPGTFTTEPTSMIGGNSDYENSAQCNWSNQDTHRDEGQPAVWLIATTRLHKANQSESGVDKAKDEIGRKPGSAVGVPDVDEDIFREVESSNGSVDQGEMTFRYHNVVIGFTYHYDDRGTGNFTQPLLEVSTVALSKVLPPEKPSR